MSGNLKITLKDLDKFRAGLTEFELNQMPFALAKTLSNLAMKASSENVPREMKNVFHIPMPFTLNSPAYVKATKENLVARVTFKNPDRLSQDEHYLTPQVEGGRRQLKPYEFRMYVNGLLPQGYFTVPGKAAIMDSYGNMSRGQIIQILAYFEQFNEGGYRSNMDDKNRAKLKKGTKKKFGISYFVIQPNNNSHLFPGIYVKTYRSLGVPIKPVLLFVKKAIYFERLDLQGIAIETYNDNFEDIFQINFKHALNTAFK